jgi:tetratricopeptide (TPR) repeat protein
MYSEWGYCLGKTKEWDKSVARLKTTEEMSPTAADKNNIGWAYYNAAQEEKLAKNEQAAEENLQQAKVTLEVATQQDPKLDAAYMNLGATNNAVGDYEAAVAALNVALSLHNDWVIALNQLGVGQRGLNNLSAAVSTFSRVVRIDGNNVIGLFNLGSAQHASGDKKGARKTQDRLKKINPALADQLGNIIAGKIIDEGTRQIRRRVRIPGLPF